MDVAPLLLFTRRLVGWSVGRSGVRSGCCTRISIWGCCSTRGVGGGGGVAKRCRCGV